MEYTLQMLTVSGTSFGLKIWLIKGAFAGIREVQMQASIARESVSEGTDLSNRATRQLAGPLILLYFLLGCHATQSRICTPP